MSFVEFTSTLYSLWECNAVRSSTGRKKIPDGRNRFSHSFLTGKVTPSLPLFPPSHIRLLLLSLYHHQQTLVGGFFKRGSGSAGERRERKKPSCIPTDSAAPASLAVSGDVSISCFPNVDCSGRVERS